MSERHILVVEDDEDILEMVSYNLEKENYRVSSVEDGAGAVEAVGVLSPDLVLLDIMLPGMDGLEVLRAIRAEASTRKLPVIILTARSREVDKIVGLELGADDYITKPFSPRELMARIKAVLRRTGDGASSGEEASEYPVLVAGELSLDTRKQKVTVMGEEVVLTATEFRVLELMLRNRGTVFTRERILDAVFGYKSDVYERTVDTHIKTLRKKLGPARSFIETVRGAGYRFRETG